MEAVKMLAAKYNSQKERTEICITRSSQAVSSAGIGYRCILHWVAYVTQIYLKK